MQPKPVILDCDPGVDDAAAILLALASPKEIDLLGITCVTGNVPLAKTTANACRIVSLVKGAAVPVFAGCARSLMKKTPAMASSHGTDGLGGVELPEARVKPQKKHAVDFIIETLLARPFKGVTLCAIGPMTNLALAVIKEPRIVDHIAEIVFMGGAAFCPGNITPEAEFNFFVDPHAAQIVLDCGAPLTMLGLDVTRQTSITAERWEMLEDCARAGGPAAPVVEMLKSYCANDPIIHDPCAIAYLINPGLFTGTPGLVTVECASELTYGKSVAFATPYHLAGTAPNTDIITGLDVDGFFTLLTQRLKSLASAA